jgi:DNA helicase-4
MFFSAGFFGRLLTNSGGWSLNLTPKGLSINRGDPVPYLSIAGVTINPGVVWVPLTITFRSGAEYLVNATREDARAIDLALREYVSKAALQDAESAAATAGDIATDFSSLLAQDVYLARSLLDQWIAARPALAKVKECLAHPLLDASTLATAPPQGTFGTVYRLLMDMQARVDQRNEKFVAAELAAHQIYFDTVETKPLSLEQRTACIVMEDRNQVVAAAGSGKTSVVIAKVGYVLKRGYVQPHEILVVAFNRAVVSQVRQRIDARLGVLADTGKISVRTFHSLGQDIIAQASGEKPSVSDIAKESEEPNAAFFESMIDDLIKRDAGFTLDWVIFRALYIKPARDPAAFRSLEDWNRYVAQTATFREGQRGYLTLQGEMVKSQGELAIANWLFMQGVPYVYEKPYKYKTATREHRQYRPDFYLPQIDCYIEHYALDKHGKPPPAFGDKYLASMEWKREQHARMGTKLIETTFDAFITGTLFQSLDAELEARGQARKSRSAAEILQLLNDRQKSEYREFVRSVLTTFIKHAKCNETTDAEIKARAKGHGLRESLFAKLAVPLVDAYNRQLAARGEVDFEDLILQASKLVSSGSFKHPYKLILIDEFQDISQSRAKLIKALLAQAPACRLFAVGDDWQSIYRFAGADLSLFTRFAEEFGTTRKVYLSQTYRCNQGLADVSSRFISGKGGQPGKVVRATNPACSGVVDVRLYGTKESVRPLYLQVLQDIAEQTRGKSRPTVLVLSRYNHVFDHLPPVPLELERALIIDQRSIHRAKGAEADFVMLMGLIEGGAYSFPSTIADDPLLTLVMPHPETTPPFAEERRLMYVALTRARHKAILLARQTSPSYFVNELLNDEGLHGIVTVTTVDDEGNAAPVDSCPQCGSGFLVRRVSKRGPFYGCSRYPACKFTRDAGATAQTRRASYRQPI